MNILSEFLSQINTPGEMIAAMCIFVLCLGAVGSIVDRFISWLGGDK